MKFLKNILRNFEKILQKKGKNKFNLRKNDVQIKEHCRKILEHSRQIKIFKKSIYQNIF